MADNKNVTVAKPKIGGAIFVAPKSTPLPEDATSPLNEGFKCLGYVGEEGLVNTQSKEKNDFKAWGGDVVDSSTKSFKDEFKYTLLEVLNLDVLKHVYGNTNVTNLSQATTIKVNSNDVEEQELVVEMILKGGAVKRIVVPRMVIQSIGDLTYNENGLTGYSVSAMSLADSSGNYHYEYINQPA